jgi:Cof subfamily protein (haloacid dehalogenase superfamily)
VKTLFVADLDGTLLRSDASLSDDTVADLRRLIAGGLAFTYATARSHTSALRATASLDLRLPAAVYAGAMVVDSKSGAPISVSDHDPDLVAAVIDLCQAAGVPPLVYCRRDGRDQVVWVRREESDGIRAYLASRGDDPRFAPAESWPGLPRRDVFYLTLISTAEHLEPLRAAMHEQLSGHAEVTLQSDTYTPHHRWLEITAPGADKGTAVLRLKELTGADRLVVFGDNGNDLPMFAVADESYAVANAIPAVINAATAVIPANDEDGVTCTLRRLRFG